MIEDAKRTFSLMFMFVVGLRSRPIASPQTADVQAALALSAAAKDAVIPPC